MGQSIQAVVEPDYQSITTNLLDNLDLLFKQGMLLGISGSAGTGKTYTIEQIVERMQSMGVSFDGGDRSCTIVAPTHKAKLVLKQRGIPTTNTIHSCIYTPIWNRTFYETIGALIDDEPLPSEVRATQSAERRCRTKFNKIDLRVIELLIKTKSMYLADIVMSALDMLRVDTINTFVEKWAPRTEPVADVIIVDESSMVSLDTMNDLQQVCKSLVMVGDDMQLPPVDNTSEDGSTMSLDAIPDNQKIVLTHNHRSDGTDILDFARLFLDEDMTMRKILNRASIFNDVNVINRVPTEDLHESPVLCWMNKTRIGINERVLNQREEHIQVGDRIICTNHPKNSSFVRNAIYTIQALEPFVVSDDTGQEYEIDTPFIGEMSRGATSERVYLDGMSRVSFSPCYSITTHRSQGSEWDRVLVHLNDLRQCEWAGKKQNSININLWRRLGYVGVSRAIKEVVLIDTK